jgi:hypothetical protein
MQQKLPRVCNGDFVGLKKGHFFRRGMVDWKTAGFPVETSKP